MPFDIKIPPQILNTFSNVVLLRLRYSHGTHHPHVLCTLSGPSAMLVRLRPHSSKSLSLTGFSNMYSNAAANGSHSRRSFRRPTTNKLPAAEPPWKAPPITIAKWDAETKASMGSLRRRRAWRNRDESKGTLTLGISTRHCPKEAKTSLVTPPMKATPITYREAPAFSARSCASHRAADGSRPLP